MLTRFLGRLMPTASLALGLVTLVSASGADAASTSAIYTYDPVGRAATALYDNGLCLAYSYDPSGNRTAQTNITGGAPVTATWSTGVWGCAPWAPSMGGMARRVRHPIGKASPAARRARP